METNYNTGESRQSFRIGKSNRNSTVYIGAFIIVAGVILFLRRIGLPIPHWLTSWEMILIGVGIIMGLKSGFKDINWLIPIIIGAIFISNDIFPGLRFSNLIWPLGLIAVGLIVLTKGGKGFGRNDFTPNSDSPKTNDDYVSGFKKINEGDTIENASGTSFAPMSSASGPDDILECVAVFGGVKRTVVSKNFKGGEVVAVFGGAEVDLTHADIQGVVKLEATNILGGTKLIVPPHWDVQSEMVAILGGVEDKRRIQPDLIDRNKRLILTGTSLLGGLEVKSF